MKKLPTDQGIKITVNGRKTRLFIVSKAKADGIVQLLKEFEYDASDSVPADEVFKDLYDKYGKSGTTLRGFRSRDGLTQVELAEKLGIPQSDVSAMEHGRRPIGKVMAKRCAAVFKTDYRVFL